MRVDERARHELYESVKGAMGVRSADTLMEYLPPVGWGDIMTRRDGELLEARLEARIDVKIEQLRADISDKMRNLTLTLISTMVALNAASTTLIVLLLR